MKPWPSTTMIRYSDLRPLPVTGQQTSNTGGGTTTRALVESGYPLLRVAVVTFVGPGKIVGHRGERLLEFLGVAGLDLEQPIACRPLQCCSGQAVGLQLGGGRDETAVKPGLNRVPPLVRYDQINPGVTDAFIPGGHQVLVPGQEVTVRAVERVECDRRFPAATWTVLADVAAGHLRTAIFRAEQLCEMLFPEGIGGAHRPPLVLAHRALVHSIDRVAGRAVGRCLGATH